MASGDDEVAVDETVSSTPGEQAVGVEPTLVSKPQIAPVALGTEAIEATLASSPDTAPSLQVSGASAASIVRTGAADHSELVTVDRNHYKFDDELARGGMGRILRARDRRLGREVAVKELLGATPELRARFEREARITARLQHPAIVNIYEAGVFPDGEPFYAMKLVAGESFDKVIARTPAAERLALLPTVLAVADALAYSHSKRIIHRDLKPQNVLVGEFGETVVIDWGLTKDLAAESSEIATLPAGLRSHGSDDVDDSRTIDGSVMGTPAFMPREQADGEPVDERADVYAIGAILYNVLAGTPPYSGKTARDVLVHVLRGPPQSLEERVPDAPADLLAIVAKAMAREAADRYPTARELADDLRRFTTGQLVAAHRYTSWELVRRWGRRHRAVLAVTGVLLAALAITAVVSVRAIVEEKHVAQAERVKADVAAVLARDKEAEARTQRAGAEKLADFLLVHMKERLEPLGRLDLMQGIGSSVVDYYASTTANDVSDDQLRQRADALFMLADVDTDAGALDAARRGYETVRELRRALVARRPSDLEAAFSAAQVEQRLGTVANRRQELAKSEAHFGAAVAIVKQLVARAPGDLKYERSAALLERLSAELHRDRGDLEGAVALGERARVTLEPLADKDDRSAIFLFDTYRTLSTIHDKRGDLAASERVLRQAVERTRRLSTREPVDMHWVAMRHQSTSHLGRWLADHGRPVDALPLLVESRDGWERLVKHDPDNVEWLADLGQSHSDLGVAYEVAARDSQAMASYQRALAIRTRVRARSPDDMRVAYNWSASNERIALLLLARGDLAGAERHFKAGAAIIEEMHAKEPANVEIARSVGVVAEQLGDVAFARGKLDEAIAYVRKSHQIATQLASKDAKNVQYVRDLVEANNKLARALLRKGDGAAATSAIQDAVARARQAGTMASDQADVLAVALVNAGTTAHALGDADAALRAAREAVGVSRSDAAAHAQDIERATTLVEAETLLAAALAKTDAQAARTAVTSALAQLAIVEKAGRASRRVEAVRATLRTVQQQLRR